MGPGYELVRVATPVVEKLIAGESEPVVVLSITRASDGTCDLIVREHVCAMNTEASS